jgi:hypothetical protein
LVSGTRRAFRRVGALAAASGARLRLARRTAKRLQVVGYEV